MIHRPPGSLAAALLAAVLAVGLPVAAGADATIRVTGAFVRAVPAGGVGGLFLTIVNPGPPDRLIGAAAAAGKVELHESTEDSGVMRMRPVAGIDIPAGATVKLAPGGYHFMLTGLAQGLAAGGQLPVTLQFQRAGKLDIRARVVAPGAGAPAGHEMGQMPAMAPAK